MGQLRFSAAALIDIEDIAEAIARNNGALVAERNVARLRGSLQTLAEFPEVGRKRSQLASGLRSWPLTPWIALYRIADDGIEIIRILHGRRRITRKVVAGQSDE